MALWRVWPGETLKTGDGYAYEKRFFNEDQVAIGHGYDEDVRNTESRETLSERLRAKGWSKDKIPATAKYLWRLFDEMEVGDKVIVPRPKRQVVSVGLVTGQYGFSQEDPHHFRPVRWLGELPFSDFEGTKLQVGGSLEPIRKHSQAVEATIGPLLLEVEHEPEAGPDLGALVRELLLEPLDFLENVKLLLTEKKQVIFQGPPGTGKTFVARKLAEALAESDESVRLVQFHPSYAYEDFVQGFRPTLKGDRAGFELRDGPLVQMAERARKEPDESHFLVIDEINRGNLSKVFGELYFLLEYRDEPMRLQYSDVDFRLPPNLYIIGTMNTADRSIALVDLALRRRFSFVEFHPEKEPVKGLLGRWLDRKEIDMPWLAKVVDLANTKLENREAAIGPSYFMKDDLDEERVGRIWEHDVLPYIEEQLYGQHERLAEFALGGLRREAAGAGSEGDGDTADEQEDEPGSSNANA